LSTRLCPHRDGIVRLARGKTGHGGFGGRLMKERFRVTAGFGFTPQDMHS
jgi:hypothetical protein